MPEPEPTAALFAARMDAFVLATHGTMRRLSVALGDAGKAFGRALAAHFVKGQPTVYPPLGRCGGKAARRRYRMRSRRAFARMTPLTEWRE